MLVYKIQCCIFRTMTAQFKNDYSDAEGYRFTLFDVDTSIANSLRRTILTDIPTVVVRTENAKDNKCNILINTSRLHNEIIKHRLSCIPVHTNDPEFAKKYVLEVDVKNDNENTLRWVTTKDFKLRDKNTGELLSEEQTQKIFPPNQKTQYYIDFVRLRPGLGPMNQRECPKKKSISKFTISTN